MAQSGSRHKKSENLFWNMVKIKFKMPIFAKHRKTDVVKYWLVLSPGGKITLPVRSAYDPYINIDTPSCPEWDGKKRIITNK